MTKQKTSQERQKLTELKEALDAAENQLNSARIILEELTGSKQKSPAQTSQSKSQIIEGAFTGENMVGDDGKTYSVPANYASKSKLVEGDRLKLTIASDGTFIYKQIQPVERTNLVGTLTEEDGQYKVEAGSQKYQVLLASVTYYKAKPGDRLTITVPHDKKSDWATIENILT